MVPYSKDEKGWWETTPEDEPERSDEDTTPENKAKPTYATEGTTTGETRTEEEIINSLLSFSTAALAIGLISPWNWYHGSGLQALRWSFEDVLFVLTNGLFNYSEWGMTPLGYIEWLMYPLLPLVFVTTFVATWYKSREGDEEFGRKASIFHLSFFGIWYLLNFFNWGVFFPSEWNYGMWIAAASGIGLHPTAYGLKERLF